MEKGEKVYKEWSFLSMACPDLKDDEHLYIKGSKASMKASISMMEIRRCVESKRKGDEPPCASDPAIDTYIEDLQIDSYIS